MASRAQPKDAKYIASVSRVQFPPTIGKSPHQPTLQMASIFRLPTRSRALLACEA
jgi:hypothetical protein